MDKLAIAALAAVTLALFWIVPENPFWHLDDPSHWGVFGYVLMLFVILHSRLPGSGSGRSVRNWMLVFLCAMPLIYLANWLRFAGPRSWLWVEIGGAAIYWVIAWLAVSRSPKYLAIGIGGHALWDLIHYTRVDFVPDWYVIACFLIDLALAIYVLARVPEWLETRPLRYRR